MQRWRLWWSQKALCPSPAGLRQRTKESGMRRLVGGDLRVNEGPELEGSCRWAGPVRRCWPGLGACGAWNCRLLDNVQGSAGNGRWDSVASSSLPHRLIYMPLWGKHQHPLCQSVSGFPLGRTEGGVCRFVGQPQPAWAFVFGTRRSLEKRLLWAVVKDPSKPLAEGQEKQSDGCCCSVSLPLSISMIRLAQILPLCAAHAPPTELTCVQHPRLSRRRRAWKHDPNFTASSASNQHHLSCLTAHFLTPLMSALHGWLLLSVFNGTFLCNTLTSSNAGNCLPMTFSSLSFLTEKDAFLETNFKMTLIQLVSQSSIIFLQKEIQRFCFYGETTWKARLS